MAGSEDLAERGTEEFYREQVARLLLVAAEVKDPGTKLELLDIASVFQKLADRSATLADLKSASSKKSA